MNPYLELETIFRRVHRVGEAMAVLHWDMAAMMPAGGAAARGEQLATLMGIRHDMLTAPRNGELLAAAAALTDLSPWQAANLQEMQREYIHATCVPRDLVEEVSRRGSECEVVWRQARKDNDFARLTPYLQEVLRLVRKIAVVKGEALGVSPYDGLLDQYEPGGSSERIDVIFDDLAAFLPGFLEAVLDHQDTLPEPLSLAGLYPVEKQKALATRLMEAWGFDFQHGRLDTSHHPFCGGYPDDVRLTTFYDEKNFFKGMMGVLHETGHALYERGLPVEWRALPVGQARGMSMHESQSLFVEMQISRSPAFARWAAPLYREAFGGSGPAWEAENINRVASRVERGLIRVDADEVTYPAHVILRYRLEKAMIARDLEIPELPEAWNAGMQELVGITPPDDRDGCMQDIHWMDGAFGYFPTYTLGAMTAAQLRAGAERDLGDLDELVARGEFQPILGWLVDKVHSKGAAFSNDDILTEATGATLDASFFKDHLKRRYLPS